MPGYGFLPAISPSDAATTEAGNLVKTIGDVDSALERILRIAGVDGVMLVKDDRVGLAGHLPRLVKTAGF